MSAENGEDCCTLPQAGGAPPQEGAAGPVRIFGKRNCPHTRRAREALPQAEFIDVLADPQALAELLRLSGGVRRVPVIQRAAAVEIGFRRGS